MFRPPLAPRPTPGRPTKPPAGIVEVSLGHAIDKFHDYMRINLARRSVSTKATTLKVMEFQVGRDFPVWRMNRGMFADLFEVLVTPSKGVEKMWREEQNLRQRTGLNTACGRGIVATTLRQFAAYCHERNWLSTSETYFGEIIKTHRDSFVEKPPTKKIRVSPTQWPEILDAAGEIHPRLRMATALSLYCARRVSEVTWLQWGNIDWDAEVIEFYNQKRGRRRRSPMHLVPLFDEIRYEILRYRNWLVPIYGEPEPDWYVCSAKVSPRDIPGVGKQVRMRRDPSTWPLEPTKRAIPESLMRENNKLLRRFGIGPNQGAGTHTWRRSRATHVASEWGLGAAQELLDHVEASTTAIYSDNLDGRTRLWDALKPGSVPPGGWSVLDRIAPPENDHLLRARRGVVIDLKARTNEGVA